MSGEAILVIEDTPECAEVFELTLQDAGFLPCLAPDAATALLLIQRHSFALALVDLSLPDLNGADLACAIRGLGAAAAAMPLIAISGALPLVDPQRLAAARFSATAAKPIRPSALVDLVRQFLPPSNGGKT